MTDVEVAQAFTVVWNGLSYLLPEYASATTLTESCQTVERHSRNPMIRAKTTRPHGSGKPRQYSEATRQAMCALHEDGMSLVMIANRFRVPYRSVHYIVTGQAR
jgi:hypothetical protein